MAISFSDAGVQFSSNNIADLRSTVPSTGSYTAGDVVLESTTGGRVSGWKRLTTSSAHVLGTDWVYFSAGTVLGTAQNTTSGTAIDFTSIPSWVKRVTVMLNGVSLSGTAELLVQIGAGSIDAASYSGSTATHTGATGSTWSTGAMLTYSGTASVLHVGQVVLANMGGNLWSICGITQVSNGGAAGARFAGTKTLSGTLDRLRLTSTNGTDTFDAGSVNILYE